MEGVSREICQGGLFVRGGFARQTCGLETRQITIDTFEHRIDEDYLHIETHGFKYDEYNEKNLLARHRGKGE